MNARIVIDIIDKNILKKLVIKKRTNFPIEINQIDWHAQRITMKTINRTSTNIDKLTMF